MTRIRVITALLALAVLLAVMNVAVERDTSSVITAAVTLVFAAAIAGSIRRRSSRLGGTWGRGRQN